MSGSLLAVDVGNSRIKFGLFDAAAPCDDRLPECRSSTAIPLDAEIPWPAIAGWVPSRPAAHAIIAGANPRGIQKVLETWPNADWPNPIIMERDLGDVLAVNLAAPEKVGVDRLLNAVAVNAVRQQNSPAVIVSSGTATTVDYVDGDGAFAGGAILPGFELSARALHEYTALLPLIPIAELAAEQPAPLGIDTRHALRSGIFWGQLGAVRELVAQLSAIGAGNSQLFLTGGGGHLLLPHLPAARWEPHLALQGLALVLSRRLREPPDRSGRQ